jgi:DNA repair exonuclease SbcCD ATPase subunit
VEERLDALCGVKSTLRESLTYRDQVEPQQFLAMKDAELKAFLVKVLQLEVLENEIKERQGALSTLRECLIRAEQAYETARAQFEQRQAEIVPLFLVDTSTAESTVMQVRAEAEAIEREVAAVQDEIASVKADDSALRAVQEKLMQCGRFIKSLQDEDSAKRREFNDETAKMQRELKMLHNELAAAVRVRDDISRWQAELEKLYESTCPTCYQPWSTAEKEIRERERLVAEGKAKLEAAREKAVRYNVLEAEIKARVFVPDEKLTKLLEVREALRSQEAAERLAMHQWVANQTLELRDRESQLMEKALRVQQRLREAQVELNEIVARNRKNLEENKAAIARLSLAEKAMNDLRVVWESSKRDHAAEADYLDMLKGFRNKIFDEVLDSISTEATSIVGTLPNAQHISIQFCSERETDSGNVRNEIRPVVFIRGVERPLRSSVSGGQLASINLAVDLAVARVISQRLGCNLNWIVLDEAFNGHDPVTKFSCLEMLKQYASDKLVIIVDHATEFKDMFAQTIKVVHQDGQSRIAS